MKKIAFIFSIMLGFIFSGCNKTGDEPNPVSSRLLAKASPDEITKASESPDNDLVIFTGNDILWFNETTQEIRFQNNISQKDVINGVFNKTIKFYLDGEYLFSSMNCVSSYYSSIYDNLVFYYDGMENKFYIMDGYPNSRIITTADHQNKRIENMNKIKTEWDKFINLLKEEGKYIEYAPKDTVITDPNNPNEPDKPVNPEPAPIIAELHSIIDSLMLYLPVSFIEEFENKYAIWVKTWERPEIIISNNPRDYAKSEEYFDLLKFCTEKGKPSWPLIIKKFLDTKISINKLLFTDLTLPEYQKTWDETGKGYNNIESAPTSLFLEYSLALLKQEKENISNMIKQL